MKSAPAPIPIEGGALGVAVVDHFRRRGATVMATSHYDALKTYAATTDGVASGAFGFNADTFAPTYQLIYGSPGRSLALEIAARLGLNPSVVDAARQNLSARETQLAEHLAKIDHDMRALEHEQRLATRERETLEAAEARMRQREDAFKQREETFKRRLTEELDTQVRQARRQIDDVIAGLKEKTTAIAQDAARHHVTTGDTGAARAGARTAVDSVMKRILDPVEEKSPASVLPAEGGPTPVVGDRVVLARPRVGSRRHGDPRRICGSRCARQTHAGERARSPRRGRARRLPQPRASTSTWNCSRARRPPPTSMSSAARSTRRSHGRNGFSMSRS